MQDRADQWRLVLRISEPPRCGPAHLMATWRSRFLLRARRRLHQRALESFAAAIRYCLSLG